MALRDYSARIRQILIVDCDVHQGNGNAVLFASNSRVFTFSMHCKANYFSEKQVVKVRHSRVAWVVISCHTQRGPFLLIGGTSEYRHLFTEIYTFTACTRILLSPLETVKRLDTANGDGAATARTTKPFLCC